MTDTTVDFSMIGQTIASGGTLTSITMTKPPQESGYWFSLADVDDDGNEITEVFHVATWAHAIPTGTVYPGYGEPFTNLVLKNIAPSAQFTVTTS